MIDAVLLDFDGTLAPNLDLPGMRRQVIELTRLEGVPDDVWGDQYIVEIIDHAQLWLTNHVDTQTAAEYARKAHQVILDIELQAAAATDPFDGIRETLGVLRQRGKRLGVVTRNCRQAVLTTFPDLLNWVDVLAARGDTPWLKPDPRHLTGCLSALGTESHRAVMVGDGRLDMKVGSDLGMFCVGVLSGSHDEPALREGGAHLIVERFSATNPWVHSDLSLSRF